MRGNDAYAVLGLRPGAERAEIDQAYRRLIKRYHPDAAGGDAGRAAEINRAYTELRARRTQPVRQRPAGPVRPPVMPSKAYVRSPAPKWRVPVFAAVMVAVAALVTTSTTLTRPEPPVRRIAVPDSLAPAEADSVRPTVRTVGLDEPLAAAVIEGSVQNARRLLEAEDPVAAAEFSRDCLSRLRAKPTVPLFDSCASYDEAIALLGAGNPMFESGPFNPVAVTARQVGAARLLSAHDFEAENRLQQIRSRVHLALLPGIPDIGSAPARRVAERSSAPRYSQAPRPAARPAPIMVQPRQPARRPYVYTPPREPARQLGQTSRTRAQKPSSPPARAPVAAATPKAPWQQPMKPAWQRPLPPPPSGS